MDHHMPKMTGLDATNVLLKEHKLPTTIIACTADVSKLVQQQFQDLGVKGVIHKPIDKHMLAEILDENTQQSSTPSNNPTNKGVAWRKFALFHRKKHNFNVQDLALR